MEILIDKETENLMKDTNAFLLLLKIAYFTKREDYFSIPDLNIGETAVSAAIVGLPEQSFRTAKKKLERWGVAKFRGTSTGTIAKITTDKFFKL